MPATNTAYWLAKFARNVQRDAATAAALKAAGWRVLILWECELQNPATVSRRVGRFLRGRTSRAAM